MGIKLFGYKIGIKFDNDALAVEQNNYLSKLVNVYIAYDLDAWPRNLTNNFKFKNCLFGAITFDNARSWSFDNDSARNFIVFGVDNSSSSRADNRKNNSLVLGEGPTFEINGSFGSPEKKLILVKQTQNIA